MREEYNHKIVPLGKAASKLFTQQLESWKDCADSFSNLSKSQVKELSVGRTSFKIQYNPGRMISSSAVVDKNTVAARPCFLCEENRPAEQNYLSFADYQVLVNPFPIFWEHYTIANKRHQNQTIKNSFKQMLELTENMGDDYAVLYNGPECGASAPDHLHFQAVLKDTLPISEDLDNAHKFSIAEFRVFDSTKIYFPDDGVRRYIQIESDNVKSLLQAFKIVYETLAKVTGTKEEPKLNILSYYNSSEMKHRVQIFPRTNHRPAEYFLEGEDKVLFSPGSVDMGGVAVTPRLEDFEKMTPKLLKHLLSQVVMSDEDFRNFLNEFAISI